MHFNDAVLAELIVDRLIDVANHFAVSRKLDFFTVFERFRQLRICCVGHIMENVIEQRGDADVVQCGRAADRRNIAVQNALRKTHQNLLTGKLHGLKIFHHEIFVRFRCGFGQLLIKLLCFRFKIAGDSDFLLAFTVEHFCIHVDDIDITLECAALHNRKLNRNDIHAEFFVNGLHRLFEICIVAIHLIDDHHSRFVLFFAHCHGLFSTDCRTGNCADDDQGCIAKSHCSGYVAVEIKEAGCIDQVDLGVLPLQRSKRHIDGNGTLDFFGVKIGCGCIVRETVDKPCIVKHSFGQSRFALSAVSEDADVADFIRGVEFHVCSPCWNLVVVQN